MEEGTNKGRGRPEGRDWKFVRNGNQDLEEEKPQDTYEWAEMFGQVLVLQGP